MKAACGPGERGAFLGGVEPFGVAFPGQGAKREDMFAALHRHRAHPLVARCLTGLSVSNPDALDFNDTAVAQPVTYALGIASVEATFGLVVDVPLVLGHSLGELTAAASAGIIDVEAGLQLAMHRGRLCREQNERRPGAMVAIMGADARGVEWVRRLAVAVTGGVLEIAGLNSSRQSVLSGDLYTIEEAVRVAHGEGLKASVLPIGGAFHSPLMTDVVPAWREAVESIEFRRGTGIFVSTVDAAVRSDPGTIRELMVRALLLPVRWLEAVRAAREIGVQRLWDAGPGDALHKLGKRQKVVEFAPLDHGARTQPQARVRTRAPERTEQARAGDGLVR